MSAQKITKKLKVYFVPFLVAALVLVKPLFFPAPIIRYGITKYCVPWEDITNNEQVNAITVHTEKQFGDTLITNETVLPHDKLDYLLFKYGVDSKGMDTENVRQKIHLLLHVSSPDFWATNFMLHPKAFRVDGFVWGHKQYLKEIGAVAALRNRNELKQRFPIMARKLIQHGSMEDRLFFVHMKRYSEKFDAEDFELTDGLEKDHQLIISLQEQIMEDLNNSALDGSGGEECNVVSDKLIYLLQEWDKEINIHFLTEEQNLVRLWINMDTETYHEFVYSLDYPFFKYLASSWMFIYRNKIRNTLGV